MLTNYTTAPYALMYCSDRSAAICSFDFAALLHGGRYRTRTSDSLRVKQVLYQLS